MPIKTSLIITTYNWPEALDLVLTSVAKQKTLPDEVIVADDGSGPDTASLLRQWRSKLPVPLVHVWQEDLGFRVARARNLAIAEARGDYLIFLDGDMVVHPRFVEDHNWAARPGCFIQGMRVLAGPRLTRQMLTHKITSPGFFRTDLGNRKQLFRFRLLSALKKHPTRFLERTAGCNMAFWKEDLVGIGAFNEDMIGWGAEDKELTVRLLGKGYTRHLLKYNAVAVHLNHPRRNVLAPEDNPNNALLHETIAKHLPGRSCESDLARANGR